MKKFLSVAIGTATFLSAAAGAVDFKPLSQSCEESLALSALPGVLRERANVYVWKNGDFQKTISSDGGFHCVVQRNHADAIIPECVTSTGEDSILQGIFAQTRMTATGMSLEEVAEKSAKMVEKGDIGSPSEPGVNYMMSAYNKIYSADQDKFLHIGPHTMFFAPGASSDVVGGSFAMAQENHGFPFVAEAGAHSYIMTFTNRSSESDDVEKNCRGQIDTSTGASSDAAR